MGKNGLKVGEILQLDAAGFALILIRGIIEELLLRGRKKFIELWKFCSARLQAIMKYSAKFQSFFKVFSKVSSVFKVFSKVSKLF